MTRPRKDGSSAAGIARFVAGGGARCEGVEMRKSARCPTRGPRSGVRPRAAKDPPDEQGRRAEASPQHLDEGDREVRENQELKARWQAPHHAAGGGRDLQGPEAQGPSRGDLILRPGPAGRPTLVRRPPADDRLLGLRRPGGRLSRQFPRVPVRWEGHSTEKPGVAHRFVAGRLGIAHAATLGSASPHGRVSLVDDVVVREALCLGVVRRAG